jgi:hypothetical protein
MELEPSKEAKAGDSGRQLLGELDLPPEYCYYRDDGCELATAYLGHKSSCLNCPFSGCIYDQPGGRQRWLKKLRDEEIVRLFNTKGKKGKELAMMFGLSQRTVQRVLKRDRDD